ncbi:unnamed protein product [Linum tenue]|uniref:Uncharacterized protein n=1 Tax=Linum tenue TaxID=586396 RepID=A0AAV0IM50_9ROSI|nr:unnamed protein product [Linum tenue]
MEGNKEEENAKRTWTGIVVMERSLPLLEYILDMLSVD